MYLNLYVTVYQPNVWTFGKRTAAILEFYVWFRLWPNFRHQCVILHRSTKFRQNRTILGGIVTLYPFFSRWRPAAILDLIWVILDHPRSAIVGLSLVLKFSLDPSYSFWDIAIFMFRHYGLKLPILAHFGEFWGHISTKFGNPSYYPQTTILGRKHVVWAIKYENR